mmetsp:Transcript_83888/g.102763  ORF Transcript_83888/g.102763 Transcript_83888/m.102763 type:complete len:88 (-) Transcript_83888:521-784(-)
MVLVFLGCDDEAQCFRPLNPLKGWQIVARMHHDSIPSGEHEICKDNFGAQLKAQLGHQHHTAILHRSIPQRLNWVLHLVGPWLSDAH